MNWKQIIGWTPVRPLDDEPEEVEQPLKCPSCHIGYLNTMHDQHGLYMKCSTCQWDSAGIYRVLKK